MDLEKTITWNVDRILTGNLDFADRSIMMMQAVEDVLRWAQAENLVSWYKTKTQTDVFDTGDETWARTYYEYELIDGSTIKSSVLREGFPKSREDVHPIGWKSYSAYAGEQQ